MAEEYQRCEVPTCVRRMRKLRTGQGYLLITKEQMLRGYGGAEECQHCGAIFCDACYPKRENVCSRCNRHELRLVLVQYATGNSAYWPRIASAIDTELTGAKWAIHLRRFLATNEQTELPIILTDISREQEQLHAESCIRRFFQSSELRALNAVESLVQRLNDEDMGEVIATARAAERRLRRCRRLADAASISMVQFELRIRQGQSYMMATKSLQGEFLKAGLLACEECASIAQSLGDTFCEAEYLTRLGNGLYSAGLFDESEQAFQRAVHLWRGLIEQDSTFQIRLAKGLMHLGTVYNEQTERTHSSAAYREAVEILEQIPNGKRELAYTLNGLSVYHMGRNEFSDAQQYLERACAILERLLACGVTRSTDDPHSPSLSFELSRMKVNLSTCLAEQGEENRAEAILKKAIKFQENYIVIGGDLAWLQAAKSRTKLGCLFLCRWRDEHCLSKDTDHLLLKEAIEHLSVALDTFIKHQQDGGATSAYTQNIVEAALGLGIAQAYNGNFDEADKSLNFAEDIAVPVLLYSALRCQAQPGQPQI